MPQQIGSRVRPTRGETVWELLLQVRYQSLLWVLKWLVSSLVSSSGPDEYNRGLTPIECRARYFWPTPMPGRSGRWCSACPSNIQQPEKIIIACFRETIQETIDRTTNRFIWHRQRRSEKFSWIPSSLICAKASGSSNFHVNIPLNIDSFASVNAVDKVS